MGPPPEYYSDAMRLLMSPFGFTFQFGLMAEGGPGDARSVVTVRMSPQHTLVMYQILKNHLRTYEQQIGKIPLPDEMYEAQNIEREI